MSSSANMPIREQIKALERQIATLKANMGPVAAPIVINDHAQLLNLGTGDPHPQYLSLGRGDMRYGQIATVNTWQLPQVFIGASGNGGAVGIVTFFNGQQRVVRASAKGVLSGLLGNTTRLLYIED